MRAAVLDVLRRDSGDGGGGRDAADVEHRREDHAGFDRDGEVSEHAQGKGAVDAVLRGTPEATAKAIASGRATRPTVTPATRSWVRLPSGIALAQALDELGGWDGAEGHLVAAGGENIWFGSIIS
jgi:hypothetical protein